MPKPILWIVIPCYNEEAVLPITAPLFLHQRPCRPRPCERQEPGAVRQRRLQG